MSDAHAHLYEKWYFPEGSAHRRNLARAPETVGLAEFRALSEWITPRRHVDALFLSFPVHGDIAAVSRFAADVTPLTHDSPGLPTTRFTDGWNTA